MLLRPHWRGRRTVTAGRARGGLAAPIRLPHSVACVGRGPWREEENPRTGLGWQASDCAAWRKHYVAALIDEADGPAVTIGSRFEVIQFEDRFARLASAARA